MSESKPPVSVPTLYEWAGGMPVLEKLTDVFYKRVAEDPLLKPIFADMDPEHPAHVAQFIAEVFGGPTGYSAHLGGHIGMIRHHLEKHLTPQQRVRWMSLLLECADAVGLPDDSEFRSAFVGYLEWGSRIAVINSQPGVPVPTEAAPMPAWDWVAAKGPYIPE